MRSALLVFSDQSQLSEVTSRMLTADLEHRGFMVERVLTLDEAQKHILEDGTVYDCVNVGGTEMTFEAALAFFLYTELRTRRCATRPYGTT